MSDRREDFTDPHDTHFDRLFVEYVDRLNRGEGLDKEEIRATHRDIANRLIHELESYESFGGQLESEARLGTLGDYTLRRQIGRGGMGVVYDAWQNSMDRQVALKVLPAGVAADHKAFHRFMREAKTAGHLHHQNVAAVYAMGVDDNVPYYAMEYVEGETLAQIIARLKRAEPETETVFGHKDGAAYFERLGRAFAEVTDGLQHAHSRGVIHRDIKPSNLILDTEGRLRILDFGLAHLEGQESLTASGDVVGTPLYMSPEQARRRKIPIDHRTDVYSLGATMYETITGRPPFRGKDHADTLSQIIEREPVHLTKLSPRIPGDLETIVLKCLRKDPADRYGTAEALAQDLRRFVRGDPIEARPQPAWERLAARLRRQRTKLAVTAMFAALVVVVGWLAYRSQRAEERIEAVTEEAQQAKHEAQQAKYETAVREMLKKIYAGQYSLQAVEGKLEGLFFKFSDRSLARMTPEEIKSLWQARGAHPVEKAAHKLAAAAEDVRKPDAHYHLAKAYFLLEREEEAKSELRKTLEYDPDFVPAKVLELEFAGFDENRYELEAIWREYRRADDWRSAWVEAHKSVGEEDWPRAAETYGELIALREHGSEPYIGSAIEAHVGRGMAYLELEYYEDAQRDFVAACILAPGFVEGGLLLGRAHYLDDEKEAAEKIFSKLHKGVSPEERNEIALWTAGVYYSLKDYEKGLDWAEDLGEEVPIKERLRSYFLYRSGETEKAIEAGREAIHRNPRDPVAYLVLASALRDDFFRSGSDRVWKLPELLHVSSTAVELDPESASAQDLLATAKSEVTNVVFGFVRRTTVRDSKNWRSLWAVLAALGFGGIGEAQELEGFFGEPVAIDLGVGGNVFGQAISEDELTLYFSRFEGNPRGDVDIYFMTRDSKDQPFVKPARPVDGLNSHPFEDWVTSSCLSLDGNEIYFTSTRLPTHGFQDSWVARFNEPGNPEEGFHDIHNLGDGVNATGKQGNPNISFDGLRLYFRSRDHFYMATRETRDDLFGNPVLLSGTLGAEPFGAAISLHERTLFGGDNGDIWVATRESIFDDLGQPVPFDAAVFLGPPINTGADEYAPTPTADWPAPGSGLYFSRYGTSILRAPWHPDCNQNGIDDLEEIEDGDAEDVNTNGIPDKCEGDIPVPFLRGDSNDDGNVDVADATFTLNWLFAGGPGPGCLAALNTNGDGQVDIADPVSTLTFLFAGGPAPYAPFPDCGPGAVANKQLGCETPPTSCAVVQ